MATTIINNDSSEEDFGEEKKEDYPISPETSLMKKEVDETTEVTASTIMTTTTTPAVETPTADLSSQSSTTTYFFLSVFSLGVHSILFLLFLGWGFAYCLQSVHDDYFVPIVQRAKRTNQDLEKEVTYYKRQCNAMDISAGVSDAEDLFIRSNSTNYGVDQMMTHGSVLFPDLLSPDTVTELRKFVVAKNAAILGTPAEFPVSQGYRRISYGIEATEDPAVIRALKEIHDNINLQHLLEGLLGENPALTEITAITAQYGCEAQAWHPDVKPDGNGVMFGRTYSHSYSLFIPLQDTTGEMGATDLCAGTHYCATMDLHELCDQNRIGMHQVSGLGYWPAGSAALFNQQVWHRGAEHADMDAEDRVVFIISFLARPNDTRQLSRGTYFHMKWNMWGHTWADLDDTVRFMSWPWNILTCLHIWRPAKNGWGYDLITAAAMRIANNQPGCQTDDLENFLSTLDRNGFPAWLDGTIDFDRDDAWQVYIRETIANILNFSYTVNVKASIFYLGYVLLFSAIELASGRSGLRTLWGNTKGVMLTHGTVLAVVLYVLSYVREQSYAKDITEGRMLMRPFPPVQVALVHDPAVPDGRVTLPTRQDVLFGGRLDAKTIGAYNRWLEFHPGNQKLRNSATANGGPSLYRSYYKGLPPVFARALLDTVMEPIVQEGGRILHQDYRDGDWLHAEQEVTDATIQKALYVGLEGPMYELHQELHFMLGDARFGSSRETSMARTSLGFLGDLERKLFSRFVLTNTTEGENKPGESAGLGSSLSVRTFATLQATEPLTEALHQTRDWMGRWTSIKLKKNIFTVGEEVYFSAPGSPNSITFPATVAHVDEVEETVDVAVYSAGVMELGEAMLTIPWSSVRKAKALYEDSEVWGDFENNGEYFSGTIATMRPTGEVDIEYDDGEFESWVPMDRYLPKL